MKNLLLSLLAIFAFSCEKLSELTVFDIEDETEITIPASTIIDSPFSIETPPISTNSESEFENNNTNSDLIESIVLKSLSFAIESPDDGNFNFLQEVRIFISADGLDEVEIAFAENLEDDNLKSIDLTVLDIELKDYVKQDSYNLRASTITDRTINEDHTIKISSTFTVDAEILGL